MASPASRPNRSLHAILGFLTLGPMSGYDLKQTIQGTINYFWNESYGQIYPMLKRLAAEGLATKRNASTDGGREKHIYAITDSGRDALRAWLAEPAEPDPVRSELLLKLFFGTQTDPETCVRHIQEHREQMIELIAEYEAVAAEFKNCPPDDPNVPFWLLTLRNGVLHRQAAVQWCDEALEVLGAIEHSQSAAMNASHTAAPIGDET